MLTTISSFVTRAPLKAAVQSSTLQFTWDSRSLAVAEHDAVTLVPVHDGQPQQFPVPGARALAVFADQIWVATRDGLLVQLASDGQHIGQHAVPADPNAMLLPATVGPPAALWTANPLLLVVDGPGDEGPGEPHSVIGALDGAILVAGRRCAHYAGGRLMLPSGLVVSLEHGIRVTGGAAVLDGTALAVIGEHARGRTLSVISLQGGRVLRSLNVPLGTMRIAPRRGLALVHHAVGSVVIFELRSGRCLGEVVFEADPVDFAIDPDGQFVVARLDNGELLFTLLREPIPTVGAPGSPGLGSAGISARAGADRADAGTPAELGGDALAAGVQAGPRPERSGLYAMGAALGGQAPAAGPRAEGSGLYAMAAAPDGDAPADGAQAAIRAEGSGAYVWDADALAENAADPRAALWGAASADHAGSADHAAQDAPPLSPWASAHGPDARHPSTAMPDAPAPSAAPSGGTSGSSSAPRSSAPSPQDPPPSFVDALEPRRLVGRLARPAALTEIDRETRTVTLWTLFAIASAWDTRRLGYGNEGHHPYEHEVAALVGMNAGFAPDYLASARSTLAEHEAALAADPWFRCAGTPIAEIAEEFGLTATAIDVLLVIAAPALAGDLARLYGILRNNNQGAVPVDERLVQLILSHRISGHDVTAALDPRAPLVLLGLVAMDRSRPRPFAPLSVDPVIVSRLRGEAPALGASVVVRHADRGLDDIAAGPGVLASAVDAMTRAGRPARIVVRGRAGTGRRTMLAALAERAGRSLGVVDATRLPRDPERFGPALESGLRSAQLAGMIPVVYALDVVVLDQRSGADLARDVIAAHPGPLALILPPEATAPLPAGYAAIELPVPTETERLAIWTRALDETGRRLRDVAGLASRYRVGAGVIRRAVASVAALDPATPSDDQIEAFLRQSRDLRLGDHARRVTRLARWGDLVLPPDIVDSLRELISRVRHRRTVFETWGMSRIMSTSRGITALFQGSPGTGKTLAAGIIARELGLDLYQVDLSKIVSKWIGETERNLATIFDAAEDGQVILLFDEADSMFAKRTEVRSSNDRYANLEVNYLLQRLDSFDGIAILTTNSGGSIDTAFKRRLSLQLTFPFPDEETRAELWRVHLPHELPRGEELSFDALAHKYKLSGGYIRNACLRAAFLAAQDETLLLQRHLDRAVALEFAEVGKLSTTGRLD